MSEQRRPLHAGGCQCGAVRYALYAEPFNPHICHCRMCQKAFGSFFAPLAAVKLADLAWTRGRPAVFASSPPVERGFCAACGTPLTFRYLERDEIDFSLGSLDDPARIAPRRQYGVESRMPWFAALHALPASRTEDDIPPEVLARLQSRQHPDGESET
ncbi:MAG: GFA family protein [Rhodospirillales bacterium]|nr:GFA family protein [Rhodospirillales bacterium]